MRKKERAMVLFLLLMSVSASAQESGLFDELQVVYQKGFDKGYLIGADGAYSWGSRSTLSGGLDLQFTEVFGFGFGNMPGADYSIWLRVGLPGVEVGRSLANVMPGLYGSFRYVPFDIYVLGENGYAGSSYRIALQNGPFAATFERGFVLPVAGAFIPLGSLNASTDDGAQRAQIKSVSFYYSYKEGSFLSLRWIPLFDAPNFLGVSWGFTL
jgi:hypothetical protein